MDIMSFFHKKRTGVILQDDVVVEEGTIRRVSFDTHITVQMAHAISRFNERVQVTYGDGTADASTDGEATERVVLDES